MYISLLNYITMNSPNIFICGDLNQMLYDFDPDSMANTEILKKPLLFFDNEKDWCYYDCNITHRVPKNVVSFVNSIFDSNINNAAVDDVYSI